jgi:hypothetical protein
MPSTATTSANVFRKPIKESAGSFNPRVDDVAAMG